MDHTFDLVVIGTGAAGSTVAYEGVSAGRTVAIIDSNPFGGTCAQRGCDPKKVLVGAADAIDWARRMGGKGINADGAGIDWPALMRFKRTFTDPVPGSREQGFESAGIAMFRGRARFRSPSTLGVGNDTITAERFVIAAGATPASLGIAGEEHLIDSTRFLELDELPPRLVFVGGGYISFEFASVAARAGSRASILHQGERPLPGFDPDLVDQVVDSARDAGISVELRARVDRVEQTPDGYSVSVNVDGTDQTFEADLVVHGAGRVPDIADMDLDAANVERDEKGVSVNEFLQSVSNPAVYAAGDAASTEGMPLTPVASVEGAAVASNLLHGNSRTVDYAVVPTTLFSIPPLASVGLQEAAALEAGLRFAVNCGDTSDWYSSRRIGINRSGYKVLVEEGTGRILGAHLYGPHADEIINVFAVAMKAGMTGDELKEVIFAYPTGASDIGYMV